MDIDFVITWVDMEDPKWKAEFAKYSGKKENEKNGVSEARFRDYGFLKYWFRGVEKFAPWVRKIHFVTSGQKPEWLDESNPKINLVNHKDYIPSEFLPTYNSVVIERYLHKIPDLAEHFVYFNDDFYIINNISTERFFKNGVQLNPNVDSYEDDEYLYENYSLEYNKDEVDMSSFKKQNALNSQIWDNEDKLNSRVRLKLLDIADDFIETIGIRWIKPYDIILTGSLCNYNWSHFSDVDLHIVIDFNEISAKKEFVQEYFNSKKNEWNESHQDLNIFGFKVELYVEDIQNDSIRDGIYSLEANTWIKKPVFNNVKSIKKSKENKIQYLASIALTKIEDLENEFEQPLDNYQLRKLQIKIDKLLRTLKEIRQNGLQHHGEMSVGNIIYKICRRTQYLDKLWNLKNRVYDKMNSL